MARDHLHYDDESGERALRGGGKESDHTESNNGDRGFRPETGEQRHVIANARADSERRARTRLPELPTTPTTMWRKT